MPLRSLFKKAKDPKPLSSSPSSSLSPVNSSRDARPGTNGETPKTSVSIDEGSLMTVANSRVNAMEEEHQFYPFPVYDSIVARCLPTIQELPRTYVQAHVASLDEDHPIAISIRTVETTSAAKIYLETRYSKILGQNADHDSASYEQNEEDQHQHRDPAASGPLITYATFASGQLRRIRSLMVQATNSQKQFNPDSYQKLRVLGKGSFGTVQLVRLRSPGQKLPIATYRRPARSVSEEANRHPEVRRSNSGQLFAMKVIRKSDMLILSQEGHLKAERDILVASQHSKWVVPLVESFQDHDHLYLVMEYMIGGDFLSLLMRMEMLPEETSQFYIAEMVLGIEELHKMKWIHRDVKPDNFLVSLAGHLKIADFGLSFDGHWSHSQRYYNETRNSLLEKLHIQVDGDEQDMQQAASVKPVHRDEHPRPEGHLLIDQLDMLWKRRLARTMVGTSATRDETKAHIVEHHGPIFIPHYGRFQQLPEKGHVPLPPATSEARHLLNALLCPRDCRLSSRTYIENDNRARRQSRGRVTTPSHLAYFVFADDARDIKRHPFFKDINWAEMHLRQPPFVPRIHADQPITKYFDDEKEILGSASEGGRPRARDKVLRDPKLSAEAMEIRKRFSFLGYEYTRGG